MNERQNRPRRMPEPRIRQVGTYRAWGGRFLAFSLVLYASVVAGVLALAVVGRAAGAIGVALAGLAAAWAWTTALFVYYPRASSTERKPTARELAHTLRRRNRRWCLFATFLLAVCVPCSAFVLALLHRATEGLISGLADTGVLRAWYMVLRHYYPAPGPGAWAEEPGVVRVLRAEQERRTCLVLTFALCLLVFGGVTAIALFRLPLMTFSVSMAGFVSLTGWTIVLRHVFPAQVAVAPTPATDAGDTAADQSPDTPDSVA